MQLKAKLPKQVLDMWVSRWDKKIRQIAALDDWVVFSETGGQSVNRQLKY